jgi:vitamin B12 transporter
MPFSVHSLPAPRRVLSALRRRFSVVLAGACVTVAAVSAVAQSASLAPVVVTGTREPQFLDRLVADVVVIDADRIRASSADSLEDLLRREGGITLSRNGGPGQNAALLLRGASANNTVVLVDGVRIGSATLGQTDVSGLSLAQIERIEVLRGPGSSLYGADAVGGVVQIFTKRGAGSAAFDARYAKGGFGSNEAEASVAGASSSFDYAAGLSREASEGISAIKPGDAFGSYNPDHDGFERQSAHARAGLVVAPGHRFGVNLLASRLKSQYDSAEFPPPNFLPDPSADYRSRFDTRLASFDYRGEISSLWTTTVQLSGQRDDSLTGGPTQSRYRTDRHQLTWQNALSLDASNQLVVAAEHQQQDIAAPFSAPGQRNNALVLGYAGRVGSQRWQADLRHDDNSAWGGVTTGKLGWGTDLTPALSVRLVAGTAFRAPSANELYFPNYGVATLLPERSHSVEAGLQWRDEAGSAGITLYRNRVGNLIAFEGDSALCPPDPAYAFGCARNLNRARLQGANFDLSRRIDELTLRATLDFLDARDVSTNQRLQRRAAHQQALNADWAHGAWTLGAALLRVGARNEGGAIQSAYTTLDLQARWRVAREWQVEAKLLNATDREYEVVRDYPGLGRQAWLGLHYSGVGF